MKRISDKQRRRHIRRMRAIQRQKAARFRRSHMATPRGVAFLEASKKNGWTILRAPSDLSLAGDSDLEKLCVYLARFRREVIQLGRRAVMDLSCCEKISSLACLMLAAEMERCRHFSPDGVNGLDPTSRKARNMLWAMGFYDHLKLNRPPSEGSFAVPMTIRSGFGEDDTISSDAHDVAGVAERVFQDPTFAKRVHGALNEALGNVQMHAYKGADPKKTLNGRWWIAGLSNPKDSEAFFFALDQGVGIPATAPTSMGEDISSHIGNVAAKIGIDIGGLGDHEILRLVVDQRRTRTGKSHHGRGMTAMINLIALAGRGTFKIFSGRGSYALTFDGADVDPELDLRRLPYAFPGTLIIWNVVAPEAASVIE